MAASTKRSDTTNRTIFILATKLLIKVVDLLNKVDAPMQGEIKINQIIHVLRNQIEALNEIADPRPDDADPRIP